MLYNDLTPIIFEADDKGLGEIHVYGIGDIHVGAPNWDSGLTLEIVERILSDPVGYVHLCGDVMNNGLKQSKTNSYFEVMNPVEQRQWVYENLKQLADRIISAVPGNHEDRTTNAVGLSPVYDIMAMWGIEERYRENLALSVVKFGVSYSGRKSVYGGLTTHGSSFHKHTKFITGFDGIDYAVSGHTHTPNYAPHGKIVLNLQNGTAKHAAYHELVVNPHMHPGDYAFKKEYEIKSPTRLDYFVLHNVTKGHNEPAKKAVDFCSIEI